MHNIECSESEEEPEIGSSNKGQQFVQDPEGASTTKVSAPHVIQVYLTRPRERFENANISIFPTFQETVGSHLKPSLPVVVMATLDQINSNHFGDFSKQ